MVYGLFNKISSGYCILLKTTIVSILSLLFLSTIFFLTHDLAWARTRLKYRHSLMIGAGLFGDITHLGDEGLSFEYQYDLSEKVALSFNPALAFPDTANAYYMQFLPGFTWRPFNGVLPRKRKRTYNLSPYLVFSTGIDYFWTDPVANNAETQLRFGLMPCVGLGFTMLFFSHFFGDVHSGIGLSWRLFGDYGETFTSPQHIKISIGMKF